MGCCLQTKTVRDFGCDVLLRPLRELFFVNGHLYRRLFFMKQIKKISVKKLCYCALFTALSVIANVFTLYFGTNSSNAVSFNYTVCFLAGALLGMPYGFIVGICGDVLGWFINSTGGAFNPAITVVTGLIGVLSGLVFYIAKKKGKGEKFIILTLISYLLILLVCTNLNTVSMYYYYMTAKYSFWPYYMIRMPKQIIFWAINLVLSAIIVKPISKLIKL